MNRIFQTARHWSRWGRLLSCIALAGIVGCSPRTGERDVYKLNYSVFFPPTHPQAKLASAWADEVMLRSQGRLKIFIFPGGALTKADQCYQGVVDNISDIGMSALAYTRGRFLLMEALDLPVGYTSGSAATHAANRLYAKYQPKALEDTHVLYLHAHGPGILASKKPVTTLSDLKGMKVRATGLSAKLVERLGGAPVSMPQSDTYESLQKGVVDATFCPMETLQGWKQGEVVTSVTDSRCIGYTTTFFVTMNKEVWAGLPADLQKILTDVSAEWIEKHAAMWDEADTRARTYFLGLGNERRVLSLSAEEQVNWKSSTKPVLDDYIKKTAQKNLPGAAFLNDLQAYLREVQK